MHQTLELPAELTIYSVGTTRADWLAWLARPDFDGQAMVRIDAARVQDVDGAGVQLLGALLRSLQEQALSWQVVTPSDALMEACGALGCAQWLAEAPPQDAVP